MLSVCVVVSIVWHKFFLDEQKGGREGGGGLYASVLDTLNPKADAFE